MSINLNGNISDLYLGSSKIGEAYLGSVKVYSSAPPALPDNVLVMEFANASYNPSSLSTLSGATWTQLSSSPNVWKWDASSVVATDWSTALQNITSTNIKIIEAGELTTPTIIGNSSSYLGMFSNSNFTEICDLSFPNVINSASAFENSSGTTSNLTRIGNLNFPKATTLNRLFRNCSSLISTGDITTSNELTSVQRMFYGCTELLELKLFNTSHVTDFLWFAYYGMRPMKYTFIPYYDTSSATDVRLMFSNARYVEHGALNLYTRLSTQTNPPTNHSNCFTDCGADTTTGAAELAQIPSSWGGTGA